MAISQLDYLPACVAGIETFIFGAQTNVGAPVVFVLHGRSGSAVGMFDICREIADEGMVAIAIDQRNHGRRMVDQRANGGWNSHHAADMYSSLVGTASDVSLLIDMLPACLGLPVQKVGVTGGSMGGHASMVAMVLDQRITVGAPLIGSGDYKHLMELRAAENACPAGEFSQFFPPELAAAVEKYDPINHPELFADRPLLMMNGDADSLVQIACNQRFEAACRPYYQHGDRLCLSVYPGLGHACPEEMWREATLWLKRWLIDEAL
ncbi:MAG TPA: dienelactone hydrolase family protein [Armatimonadota bacterium]|nr:dienelactone hydrolase family protein [Armatimonadota bacterium]